ncbi:MAG: hypothetical protein RLZZ69_2971, partial [Cyanobacteriota bacterium]
MANGSITIQGDNNQALRATNGQPGVNVTGTAGPDIINGSDGNDSLEGDNGDDLLNAGAGDDSWVSGGAGNDRI